MAFHVSLGNLLDEARGGGRGQRLAAELVHDLQVVLDVRALLQVDGAGELLDVDHVRQVPLLEAQDGERPARAGVTAAGERDDLDGHVRHRGHLDEVAELGAHHRGAADRPPQHRLVHDRPDPGRVRPGEQVLALEAQPDPALDLRRGRGLVAQPGDGPRVVLGLEQAVHELDLEAADGGGRGLQAEVGLEPVGQDVAVLGPPVRLAGLLGQGEEPRPLPARRSRRTR